MEKMRKTRKKKRRKKAAIPTALWLQRNEVNQKCLPALHHPAKMGFKFAYKQRSVPINHCNEN
jgi:hypothetical protein